MSTVAVCVDSTPPAEGAAYSACTSVVWTDSSNVVVGLFDGYSIDDGSTIALYVLACWFTAWGFVQMIRALSTVKR